MNKAAKLIAESITGESYKTVPIGRDVFTIYPPTIKTISRAIVYFSKVDIENDYSLLSIISEIPCAAPDIMKGLAVLIVGDVKCWRWKTRNVYKVLESSTPAELKRVLEIAIHLISGQDFFDCATLAKSVSRMAGRQA